MITISREQKDNFFTCMTHCPVDKLIKSLHNLMFRRVASAHAATNEVILLLLITANSFSFTSFRANHKHIAVERMKTSAHALMIEHNLFWINRMNLLHQTEFICGTLRINCPLGMFHTHVVLSLLALISMSLVMDHVKSVTCCVPININLSRVRTASRRTRGSCGMMCTREKRERSRGYTYIYI